MPFHALFRQEPPKNDLLICTFLASLLFLVFLMNAPALAERSIIEAGDDKSRELTAVANIIKTLQTVAYTWVAPAIGGCLTIYGVYKIALREAVVGTMALICGGSMFFIQKIIESLAKMAG